VPTSDHPSERVVLSVDPGQSVSAYVKLSQSAIVDHGMKRNEDVLSIVATSNFTELAIEMIASYGMRVGKSVFETCVFIGELKATAEARGVPVRLVYRKDVKKFVCGTHLANDRDVRRAMVERYGDSGSKSAPGRTYGITQDVWQALALATTALHDSV
jgi:hypothetical protein